MRCSVLLSLAISLAGFPRAATPPPRLIETVLPGLRYGPSCSSAISLQNLGEQDVSVDIEGHRSSGALVPIEGHPGMRVRLGAGEIGSYKLHIPDEEAGAWATIRERVPVDRPVARVAVSATTECVVKNELHQANREVAYPLKNPWFSGEVADVRGNIILLINTTVEAVTATVCYSAGYYSVPATPPRRVTFRPICSADLEFQIPPFGSRRFPIEGDPQSQFLLRTSGDGIVLQMLRPVHEGVRIYEVDSTIKFGEEVPNRN
jgi:hypothetical protein